MITHYIPVVSKPNAKAPKAFYRECTTLNANAVQLPPRSDSKNFTANNVDTLATLVLIASMRVARYSSEPRYLIHPGCALTPAPQSRRRQLKENSPLASIAIRQ
jgi:hypothetical protein